MYVGLRCKGRRNIVKVILGLLINMFLLYFNKYIISNYYKHKGYLLCNNITPTNKNFKEY